MIIWRSEHWFNDDFESRRDEFLRSNSKSFVWNGDDLPVDVLFPELMTLAPVDVTLAVAIDGPILVFTLSGAVSSHLASTAQFGGKSTKLETISAVSDA